MELKIICEKCSHKWTYRGQTKGKIHCPKKKCHSTQNEENRRRFGRFDPQKFHNRRGK